MSSDLRDFLFLLIGCAALPAALALFFRKVHPLWSGRKVVILSAFPVPVFVWLLCLYVFLNASFATKEDCGVDACGMAMAFSVIIAFAALAGFGVGILSAWLVRKIAAR